MKIGQGLGRTERLGLRHEGREQVERAVGLSDERRQRSAPVTGAVAFGTIDERAARRIAAVGGRQEGQGEMINALVMAALGNEPMEMTSPQFAKFVRAEIEVGATVLKAAGIKPQ